MEAVKDRSVLMLVLNLLSFLLNLLRLGTAFPHPYPKTRRVERLLAVMKGRVYVCEEIPD